MREHYCELNSGLGDIVSPIKGKKDMVVYITSPSTWEVEANGSEVQSHLQLASKIQVSL